MQLGMIGLGRMGGNIVRRLMKGGHTAVVYDKSEQAVAALAADGATGAKALEDFVAKLEPPRTAWVMLPAGKNTQTTLGGRGGRVAPTGPPLPRGRTPPPAQLPPATAPAERAHP